MPKVDLVKIGHEAVDWIRLALHRAQMRALVITVTNFRVP